MCRMPLLSDAPIMVLHYKEYKNTKNKKTSGENMAENDLQVTIKTNKGEINLRIFADKTPLTAANFINLIQRNYYDGLAFHRVIADFMVQGGCPHGTGTGGPGYNFEDEFDASLRHSKGGILSMANAGPGTNGSQFFITHVATPWLDDHHTVFGEVLNDDDLAVVNSIAQGDTIEGITISGDVESLLQAQEERVAEWNKQIDKAFPDLD